MSKYFYADVGDRLVEELAKVYGDRWLGEEVEVLRLVAPVLGGAGARRCLAVDLGCGRGRLIPWLRGVCRSCEIVALDLDISRLVEALSRRDAATDILHADAASVPLRSETADFVLCSHVIQHVPRAACRRILEELYRVLKPGSYALLLTTHSERGEEYYIVGGKSGAKEVDAETFDDYASNPRLYELPVRKFDIRKLLKELEGMGFAVVKTLFYHTLPPTTPGSEALRSSTGSGSRRAGTHSMSLCF